MVSYSWSCCFMFMFYVSDFMLSVSVFMSLA